jgi:tetratricopeptide (TPR) repeat protein
LIAVAGVPRDPGRTLRELQGGSRPLEVAIAELPFAPYQPQRGGRGEAEFDPALRKLLEAKERGRPGAERALAMLYLLRAGPGDAARAHQLLAAAPDAPETDVDRGVLLFVQGDLAAALDRFARAPELPAAKFDSALVLQKLGLRARAAKAFAPLAAEKTPWSEEAGVRAKSLQTAPPPPAPSRRLEVMRELLAASDAAGLDRAARDAQGMPDLLALAGKLDRRSLAVHAELYLVYTSLRTRAVTGAASRAEVEEFARRADVADDPLLWSAALELAGYLNAAQGDWRAAEPFEAKVAAACPARGCAAEVAAIALDELSDLAARDGDFPSARKLQDRAEALLGAVDARPQLAELHRKRAALLDEEGRLDEAARAAQAALRELAESGPPAALALAVEQAAEVADERKERHAARELGEAALELARESGNSDVEVDAAARLATQSAALGDLPSAREHLAAAIARLEAAGHQTQTTALRAQLAVLLLDSGHAREALAESERGLGAAAAGAWESSRTRLHAAHARALQALARPGEASAELRGALDELAHAIAGASDPAPLLEMGGELVAQIAPSATSAEELALPLDRLRAAALGVAPAAPGWSRALPEGACVLTLVPSGAGALQGIATRAGGAVRQVASAQLAQGTEACAEVWLFAGAPFDRTETSGVVTSLTRLLAEEPPGAPRRALFVSAQTSGDTAALASALPGAEAESAALRALGAEVDELSGERATVEMTLRLAAQEPFLHFAVHGFGGSFLQLAGDGGRLAAREIAQAHLLPRARVVLSSCEAGAPGARSLSWAFARAGAAAIAAPRGAIDDALAARWSEKFYAALGRGGTFAQAARQARLDGARFVVVK